MSPPSTPFARFRGPDPVFDLLMIVGPLVLAAIALWGRTLVTSALAGSYLLAFVGYVLYSGSRGF